MTTPDVTPAPDRFFSSHWDDRTLCDIHEVWTQVLTVAPEIIGCPVSKYAYSVTARSYKRPRDKWDKRLRISVQTVEALGYLFWGDIDIAEAIAKGDKWVLEMASPKG